MKSETYSYNLQSVSLNFGLKTPEQKAVFMTLMQQAVEDLSDEGVSPYKLAEGEQIE